MRASRVKAITQNQADMGPSGSDFSWRNDDLAMFNLAIGSKLRACDLTALKVDDVAMSGHVKSHGDPKENWAAGPVRNHRADEGYGCSLDRYGRTSLRPLPLPQPHLCGTSDTYSQYAALVSRWIASLGLAPTKYGTHSLRCTKPTLIYRRTGNLRAVQLGLGMRSWKPHDTMTIAERFDL
jgi:hypothetical protein